MTTLLVVAGVPVGKGHGHFESILNAPSVPGRMVFQARNEMPFRKLHDALVFYIKISVTLKHTPDVRLPDLFGLWPVQGWVI